MRGIHSIYLWVLIAFNCVTCTSSHEIIGNSVDGNSEVWEEMPEPITLRYPMVRLETLGNATPVSADENPSSMKSIKPEYFNCAPSEKSVITDGIATVDVSFIEADILDALLELSLLTGISIITDDSIEGVVSINFFDKSLDDVITAIIAPGNYAFKKFDSFIYVGSQSPASPSFHLLSETCTYKPVFVKPSQIVELLTPYYRQYVNYIEDHDHISIVAPNRIQQRIQSDLRIFDQVPQQILLEMSIIEVSAAALDLLGVKWRREASSTDLLRDNSNGRGNIFSYYQPDAINNPVAQALIESLSALNTGEEIQVRAIPSLVTLNGRQANFSSIQTTWLPMLSLSNNNSFHEVSYGVNLRIIPYISKENQIRLEILQASVSDLTKDFDGLPKLISHTISTSVIMRDGETLVLGGLIQRKSRNQLAKVPGISRTPLLGNLFKHTQTAMISTEILIVIRPSIL